MNMRDIRIAIPIIRSIGNRTEPIAGSAADYARRLRRTIGDADADGKKHRRLDQGDCEPVPLSRVR